MSTGGNAGLGDELRTNRQGPGPHEKELQSRLVRADANHSGGIALSMPLWVVVISCSLELDVWIAGDPSSRPSSHALDSIGSSLAPEAASKVVVSLRCIRRSLVCHYSLARLSSRQSRKEGRDAAHPLRTFHFVDSSFLYNDVIWRFSVRLVRLVRCRLKIPERDVSSISLIGGPRDANETTGCKCGEDRALPCLYRQESSMPARGGMGRHRSPIDEMITFFLKRRRTKGPACFSSCTTCASRVFVRQREVKPTLPLGDRRLPKPSVVGIAGRPSFGAQRDFVSSYRLFAALQRPLW